MGRLFVPQYRKGRNGIDISGDTVLDCIRQLGVEIAAECGGIGKCGKCIVRIEKGEDAISGKTELEKNHPLGEKERLACQARIVNPAKDIYVYIKDYGRYTVLSESIETTLDLNPFVKRRGDSVIHCSGTDLGPYQGEIFGLAIDVGTTTLVIEVIDLEDGRVIGTIAGKNPQIVYGNDVISRIDYTMRNKEGLKQLQHSVIKFINDNLEQLEKEKGEIRRYIYDIVAVGNSTMRNIFFGLPVESLGVIPYEPEEPASICKKAIDMGLAVNPKCNVYGPHLIGGHCGADAFVDILSSGMYKSSKIVMVIDIGTNGEVIIGNKDRMMSVSCAAGGAYEGATVRCGVGAVEGAIKNIWIDNGDVNFETINGKKAVGICGSGLIDLLAELLRNNIMDKRAKITRDYCITGNLCITQEDIYQLITAKAGLRTDQDLLMKYYGVGLEQIDRIYIAGGFGNFINAENAVRIGLLPPAAEKVVRIGNGALAGARQLLLSMDMGMKAKEVITKIEHVKPNEREKEFAYIVAEKMYFEKM